MTSKVIPPRIVRAPITVKELHDIGEVDIPYTATEIDDVEISPEAEEALRERYSSFGEKCVRGAIRDAKIAVLEAREKRSEAEANEASRLRAQRPAWKPLAKSSDDYYRKLATKVAGEYQSFTEAEHFENLKTIDKTLSEIDRESKGNWRAFACRVFWNLRFALMAAREKRVELEHRVEALEAGATANLADAWQGTWKPGVACLRGQLCTHRGSLWLAVRDATAQPGTENSGYQLVVKHGRDARGPGRQEDTT